LLKYLEFVLPSRSDMERCPWWEHNVVWVVVLCASSIHKMCCHSFLHDNPYWFFFYSKHNRPPSTKPSSDTMWWTIICLPLPDGFGVPVVRPWRNASLDDFIVLSIHVLLKQSSACVDPCFSEIIQMSSFFTIFTYTFQIPSTP
jgi:hypothetical protein